MFGHEQRDSMEGEEDVPEEGSESEEGGFCGEQGRKPEGLQKKRERERTEVMMLLMMRMMLVGR